MTRKLSSGLAAVFVAGLVGPVFAAQSILLNASLENGDGASALDPMIPASWTLVGQVVERSAEANLVPDIENGHALKAFQSDPQETAFQEVAATPGQSVTISAKLFTKSGDKLGGDATAGIALSFYNGAIELSSQVDFSVTAASPSDTWIPLTVGPFVVPGGANKVRMTCVWLSDEGSGSVFWDDCQLTINGGPNLLLNGDFELAGQGEQSPTGIDDWNGFNDQEKSDAFAYHGASSVKLGVETDVAGLYQTRTGYVVTAGDHLLLRSRVYHSSADPLTANERAGLKLEFAQASSASLPPPVENLEINSNSTAGVWTQVALQQEVPVGAQVARITLIYVPDTTVGANTYFDAASASVGGGNLLLNSSFEDGEETPANWTPFQTGGICGAADQSCAVKSAFEVTAFDGFSTAKAAGEAVAGFYQNVSVTAGQTLDATVRVLVPSALPGTAHAGIKIEWFAGNIPNAVDITIESSANTITAGDPTDTWIPLEIDFTMPAGTTAYPRFVAILVRGTGTGEVYFDACELVVLNKFDGADADGDDDEDLRDFADLQRCFNGDGAEDLGFNCSVFDNDADLDVDLTDFEYFQPRLTGP